jgi:hypothetical protein
MNKNTKKIVAIVLAMGIISAAAPTTNINLLTTRAYASDDNDEDYLDSLNLYDEDGDSINVYSNNDYSYRINDDDIEEGETYYAKTSSDTVGINIEGPSDKYVKVFNGTSSLSKGKDIGDDIEISDNEVNTLIIKVYSTEPEEDIRYKDNDDYDILSTYKIKVEYTNYGEDKENNNIYLERLSINNNMIDLSESKLTYIYNVDSDVKEVTIRPTPEDDDYDVKIDSKRIYSSDNYKETVDLDEGTNEFEIELEDGDKDRIYTLIINRGNPSSTSTSTTNTTTKNAEDYDNIYLDKLVMDGKIIALSKSIINYSYNVPRDKDEVIIKAEPPEDYYTVIVGDNEIDENDDYKTTVHLNTGENAIKIDLKNENSDDERVYTLNITRGSTSSISDAITSASDAITPIQNTEADVTEVKSNQWVQVNGKWQYNDATGNLVKNTWVENYYVQDNGDMATGWLNYDGSWYYLGEDGARKIGWQSINKNWYYLNSQGKIQTGWIKDVSGKYYYLNSYGAMVYNTTVDGYKLGSDGAWTGK